MKQWSAALFLTAGCVSALTAASPAHASSCAAAGATHVRHAGEFQSFAIEVDGGVAGLTRDQLRRRLLREMAAGGLMASCGGGERPAGDASRIVWSFRPLPSAAGTVRYLGPGSRGTITPATLPQPVEITARLIVNGLERGVASGTACLNGYQTDDALAPLLAKIVRRLANDLRTRTSQEYP